VGETDKESILLSSRKLSFGPMVQTLELRNSSEEEITVQLNLVGSKSFSIPDKYRLIKIKPNSFARIPVRFKIKMKGYPITLNAVYRSAIQVWTKEKKGTPEKRLIDSIPMSGSGPGFVPFGTLHCFESREQHKPQSKKGNSPPTITIIVKNIIFDTNISTPCFSDNYNLTTEYTEKHRACI
jgi:hypothetical protein